MKRYRGHDGAGTGVVEHPDGDLVRLEEVRALIRAQPADDRLLGGGRIWAIDRDALLALFPEEQQP